MKELLGSFGVAGLLCLPCLVLGGVVGLAAVGGALTALATNPLVQLTGLALLTSGAALYWRARRRAACAVDSAPDAVGRGEELAHTARGDALSQS